jgi:bacterioferritin
MKGNELVLKTLNDMLADELTAINQYMVHSEMCADWGYNKLHQAIEKRAIDEMKHAESLIGRILYLEGIPTVSVLNKMHIGGDVLTQFKNDLAGETDAIKFYNKAMQIASDAADNGSRELIKSLLLDEEGHADWLETQLEQIDQIGLQNYLIEQI